MYPLKQSVTVTVPFFAFDVNGDSVTGLVAGSWTERISKGGGAFGAMVATITEMENGWYELALDGTHTGVAGILSLSLSAASCKRVNLQFRIDPRLPADMAFPVVTGRGIDVDASGGVEITPNQAVNTAQVDGVAVTANVAMMGVNLVNIGGQVVSTATAQIGVNVVEMAGATVTATVAMVGVNVVGIASTGSALTAVPWNAAWATTGAGYTAVPWNAAWAANVNAEVVDALSVDNYGELGVVAPSVSVPLSYKIGWLYKLSRNKVLTSASAIVVLQDDGLTEGHKSTIDDDGTTFTRGEFGAP